MWWGEYEREAWGLLRDPYFFEIIFSQGEKYTQVNVLFLKQREIFGEANLLQELCQILQE